MSKVVEARYDAVTNLLRLAEPLEGVQDHATVNVLVMPIGSQDRPWLAFQGCLSPEDGDELAMLIEEMFPTEK